jgi:hypothetical protein
MTNLAELTPELFNSFGSRQYTYSVLDKKVFNGLRPKNIKDTFRMACKNVLRGRVSVNIVQLRLCLFQLLLDDPSSVNCDLLHVFDEITKEIGDEINAVVIDDTFTIQLFLEKYQHLHNTTQVLRKLLEDFEKNVQVVAKKTYSHINLVRSYTIYRNIVARQYFSKDGDLYLYELLCKYISKTSNSTDIIKTFKIFQHYEKLSYAVKPELCLFDTSINNKFTLNTGEINSQLSSNLFSEITSTIFKLSADVKSGAIAKENIKDKLNMEVRDTVYMLEKISDKYQFIVEYYNNLSQRLLSGKTCGLIEHEVLRFVSYNSDP